VIDDKAVVGKGRGYAVVGKGRGCAVVGKGRVRSLPRKDSTTGTEHTNLQVTNFMAYEKDSFVVSRNSNTAEQASHFPSFMKAPPSLRTTLPTVTVTVQQPPPTSRRRENQERIIAALLNHEELRLFSNNCFVCGFVVLWLRGKKGRSGLRKI
jgi:hypothetical protein